MCLHPLYSSRGGINTPEYNQSSLTWRHCRADESHIMLHSYATEQHDFCSLTLFFPPQRHCILTYRKRMLQTSAAIKYIFNPQVSQVDLLDPLWSLLTDRLVCSACRPLLQSWERELKWAKKVGSGWVRAIPRGKAWSHITKSLLYHDSQLTAWIIDQATGYR